MIIVYCAIKFFKQDFQNSNVKTKISNKSACHTPWRNLFRREPTDGLTRLPKEKPLYKPGYEDCRINMGDERKLPNILSDHYVKEYEKYPNDSVSMLESREQQNTIYSTFLADCGHTTDSTTNSNLDLIPPANWGKLYMWSQLSFRSFTKVKKTKEIENCNLYHSTHTHTHIISCKYQKNVTHQLL